MICENASKCNYNKKYQCFHGTKHPKYSGCNFPCMADEGIKNSICKEDTMVQCDSIFPKEKIFQHKDSPQKFWMVWSEDSPTTKYRHPTKPIAQKEANRIAKLPENIGRKVYVLEAIDYRFVEASPLTTVDL